MNLNKAQKIKFDVGEFEKVAKDCIILDKASMNIAYATYGALFMMCNDGYKILLYTIEDGKFEKHDELSIRELDLAILYWVDTVNRLQLQAELIMSKPHDVGLPIDLTSQIQGLSRVVDRAYSLFSIMKNINLEAQNPA
jgi:hypothetical protein